MSPWQVCCPGRNTAPKSNSRLKLAKMLCYKLFLAWDKNNFIYTYTCRPIENTELASLFLDSLISLHRSNQTESFLWLHGKPNGEKTKKLSNRAVQTNSSGMKIKQSLW